METVACSCGSWCSFQNSDEPCWGKVGPVDQDLDENGEVRWIHACLAHEQYVSIHGKYKPRPETQP